MTRPQVALSKRPSHGDACRLASGAADFWTSSEKIAEKCLEALMVVVTSSEDFTKVDALVGARVRLLRERRKMSQTALGEKIGVSFQQVQKYERGTNRISASALFQIAKALDVVPSDFFEGIQKEQQGGLDWSRMIDPQVNELLNGFGRISSPAVRAKIVDLIKSLAETDDAGLNKARDVAPRRLSPKS